MITLGSMYDSHAMNLEICSKRLDELLEKALVQMEMREKELRLREQENARLEKLVEELSGDLQDDRPGRATGF